MKNLNCPIILIGAARSGTTLLGDILSQHQDIAYWIEPKYIWKIGSPDIINDIRIEEEATPSRIKYIHRKFLSYQLSNSKRRFLEKTPSNCFRIPFINKVFPDAIYINIVRDGRDVALSAYEKWNGSHDKSAYSRRMNFQEVPFGDMPFYVFDFAKQFIGQRLWPTKLKKWGPMTHDIKNMVANSVEEACALQWRQSSETSLKELKKIPQERVVTLKYEDFIKNPEYQLSKLMKFCDLKESSAVHEYAKNIIKSNNSQKWLLAENKEFIDKVNSILEPLLEELQYT